MRPNLKVVTQHVLAWYSTTMFGIETEMHDRRCASYQRWNLFEGQWCFVAFLIPEVKGHWLKSMVQWIPPSLRQFWLTIWLLLPQGWDLAVGGLSRKTMTQRIPQNPHRNGVMVNISNVRQWSSQVLLNTIHSKSLRAKLKMVCDRDKPNNVKDLAGIHIEKWSKMVSMKHYEVRYF